MVQFQASKDTVVVGLSGLEQVINDARTSMRCGNGGFGSPKFGPDASVERTQRADSLGWRDWRKQPINTVSFRDLSADVRKSETVAFINP